MLFRTESTSFLLEREFGNDVASASATQWRRHLTRGVRRMYTRCLGGPMPFLILLRMASSLAACRQKRGFILRLDWHQQPLHCWRLQVMNLKQADAPCV